MERVIFRVADWKPTMTGSRSIKAVQQVFDEETGDLKNFGIVASRKEVNGSVIEKFKHILFVAGMYAANPKTQKAEIHWLKKTDFNGSKKDRNTEFPILFYEYSPEEERKKTKDIQMAEAKLMNFIFSEATSDELFEFAESEGINSEKHGKNNKPTVQGQNILYCQTEILRIWDKVKGETTSYELFMGKFNDPSRKLRAIVRKGLNTNVIENVGGNQLVWGQSTNKPKQALLTVSNADRKNIIEDLVSFFSREENEASFTFLLSNVDGYATTQEEQEQIDEKIDKQKEEEAERRAAAAKKAAETRKRNAEARAAKLAGEAEGQ